MSRRPWRHHRRLCGDSPRLFAHRRAHAESAFSTQRHPLVRWPRLSLYEIAAVLWVHNELAMLPSQTVENYLKTIYLAQTAAPDAALLVPMGHLSSALGVVPGTATTMMKTLAEAGLVHYEPYLGVRLTPAGHKLASLVLRRHRL